MFVPSRSRREGPDPHLDIKIGLFSLGAALALIGMFANNRWVLAAATVILLAGFLLQFRRHRTSPADPDEARDDEEPPSAP